jgi:tetratricopeptide (TPR) repeat protein
VELDPLSPWIQTSFAWLLYEARKYDDALEQCKKVLEFDPEYPFAYGTLGLCYIQKSLFPESIAALQKAVALTGNSRVYLYDLAYAYEVSGNHEKALETVRELDKPSDSIYVSKCGLASIQAAFGDKDKAFESLESAYKERDGYLIFIKFDPKFDVLRSDPRFEMILKKIGMEK